MEIVSIFLLMLEKKKLSSVCKEAFNACGNRLSNFFPIPQVRNYVLYFITTPLYRDIFLLVCFSVSLKGTNELCKINTKNETNMILISGVFGYFERNIYN